MLSNSTKKTGTKKDNCKILSSPCGDFVHTLHQLHEEVQKRLDTALTKSKDLTLSQYLVLVGLFIENVPLSQVKLAENLHLTEATISRHISILEKKGLLVREREDGNKKTYSLTLSPLGKKTFISTEETLLETIEALFLGTKERDIKKTSEVMKHIIIQFQKEQ